MCPHRGVSHQRRAASDTQACAPSSVIALINSYHGLVLLIADGLLSDTSSENILIPGALKAPGH